MINPQSLGITSNADLGDGYETKPKAEPKALSSSFLRNLLRKSNSSGRYEGRFPCLEIMVLSTPADVVALTSVSLFMQSVSRRAARTVSTAGDFPVPA